MYKKVEVTIDFYKIFFYNEKYGENYEQLANAISGNYAKM